MSTTKNTEGLKYDALENCKFEATGWTGASSGLYFKGYLKALVKVAAPLERENVELRELVQKLVNALAPVGGSAHDDELCARLAHDMPKDLHRGHEPCPVIQRVNGALSLAKDQGFEPKH